MNRWSDRLRQDVEDEIKAIEETVDRLHVVKDKYLQEKTDLCRIVIMYCLFELILLNERGDLYE